MTKYRIKPDPDISEHYIEDCKRIVEALAENQCDVTLREAYDLWRKYSETYAAGWLSMDSDTDASIFSNIFPYLEEVDE